MPKNATPEIPARAMTIVTDSPVTAIRLQNQGIYPILICVSVTSEAPANTQGSLELKPGETLLPDRSLDMLWPGLSGASHVWVWTEVAGKISVSHA